MNGKKAFTLTELMAVVIIVAILAAVAIPIMSGRVNSAKWSEARSNIGTIAVALRAYSGRHSDFAAAPTFTQLGIVESDLNGNFFSFESYIIDSASANGGVLSYSISANATLSTKGKRPDSPAAMTLTVVSSGPAVWTSSN